MSAFHDPVYSVGQLRQTLSAGKLATGFLLGAGCPCSVKVPDGNGGHKSIIPDVNGLTSIVREALEQSDEHSSAFEKLSKAFMQDGVTEPNVEIMLNRVRSYKDVAGSAGVRDLSAAELTALDREICQSIRAVVTRTLPTHATPFHALAAFIGNNRTPFTEVFTTNYDLLIEQALEQRNVPYFDGFIGSHQPFFDRRAIEDNEIPNRWSRLWKLHGSLNWRFNRQTRAIFRSENCDDGDELLIHPSHLKYDASRRMPYFIMIDRLRTFLRRQPVALVICGYSFGDNHINEAIVEGLKINSSAACFALQFGSLKNYGEAMRLAKETPNLSILAEDSAVIRRQEAQWKIAPTSNPETLDGAFEVQSDKSSGTEALRACIFQLGNFKLFGQFLDRFSGDQPLGS